jgi:predicted transcriptional regulator
MTTLNLGIATYEEIKKRTRAIARGELKPGPQDPKVWFPSAESMAHILSAKNRELLETIRRTSPGSLSELAEATGRKKPNLSRTLKTMAQYGLVQLRRRERKLIPRVPYSRLSVTMELAGPANMKTLKALLLASEPRFEKLVPVRRKQRRRARRRER